MAEEFSLTPEITIIQETRQDEDPTSLSSYILVVQHAEESLPLKWRVLPDDIVVISSPNGEEVRQPASAFLEKPQSHTIRKLKNTLRKVGLLPAEDPIKVVLKLVISNPEESNESKESQ